MAKNSKGASLKIGDYVESIYGPTKGGRIIQIIPGGFTGTTKIKIKIISPFKFDETLTEDPASYSKVDLKILLNKLYGECIEKINNAFMQLELTTISQGAYNNINLKYSNMIDYYQELLLQYEKQQQQQQYPYQGGKTQNSSTKKPPTKKPPTKKPPTKKIPTKKIPTKKIPAKK